MDASMQCVLGHWVSCLVFFWMYEYARRGFLMFYRQVCGHFFGRHCLIVLALLWDLEGYHSACAVQCSFLPKDLCKIHF